MGKDGNVMSTEFPSSINESGASRSLQRLTVPIERNIGETHVKPSIGNSDAAKTMMAWTTEI